MVKLADEGPDGALAGYTHPGDCGRAPPAETTPGQLIHSSWQDAEKFGVRAWLRLAGFARLREGRAIDRARQLLSIKCRQWHAVIKDLIFTSPERDHVARSRRGMLVCTGVEDGISLSWGREWGTQDLIRRKLIHLGALWSSARLFFPHKSQGGRKREGARGRVAL